MAAAPRRDVHVTQWVARPALGSRHEEMGLLGVAKVVLRILLVLGATASALVAACFIKCLVFPIDKVIGRAWLDRYVVAAWADAVIGGPILPRGPALKLSGELPAPERRAGILIANHQLDTDWFYLWDVCRVVGAHGALKIVMLDDMRTVPLVGWIARLVGFIFVSRRKRHARPQNDVEEIQRGVSEIAEGQAPSLILLFPEGTTVNEEAKRKSDQYALSKERPRHELLLAPRTAGFVAACRGYVARGVSLDDIIVYDATMAYSGYRGEVPAWDLGFERNDDVDLPNAAKLFKGAHGDHVRVHVNAYRASEIFEGDIRKDADSKATTWLDERWVEKNSRMKAFATTGDFEASDVGETVLLKQPAMLLPFALLTAGWLGSLSFAAFVAFLAFLVLLPVLLITMCGAFACCLVVVPCIGLGLCALGPLAAAKRMYDHDRRVASPLLRRPSDKFDDDGDEPVVVQQ